MQVSPSPTRHRGGPVALVALAITVAVPSIASAHAVLTAPRPRNNRDDYKDNNGGAPCGVARTTTQPSNSLTPGAPFTVTWDETVTHPGCFVIDFSASGDSNWQVLSTVAHKSTGNTPRAYTAMVTLPSAPCTACTLRLRQIMLGSEPAAGACPPATVPTNATYYTCANVVMAGSADGGAPDSGGAGGGGRGGGTGSGGRGGNTGGATGTGGAISSSGGATNAGSGGAVTSSGGATNPGSGGAVTASGGATNPGSGGAVTSSGGATGSSGGAGGGAGVIDPEPPPCTCGVVTSRTLSSSALLFGALLAMTLVRGRARKRSKPNQTL